MLKPVFTEKSLKMAKLGKYSFWVDAKADKISIKAEIARVFGVHVTDINTTKKAIVQIKDGEKIDIYEESKK